MKALLSVAAIAASVLTATPASAVILGFDDIVSGVGEAAIPSGYAGLNWQNFYTAHKDAYPDGSYGIGTTSGSYIAFNGYGQAADIVASTGTFSFDGGWFTSAWEDNNVLLIEGFTDGDIFADLSLSVTLSTQAPLFVDVNWSGLQKVRFSTSSWHFAMDDLRINEGPATEVPEPLTIGLLGMGLLGVAGARRRRRTA